MGFIRTNQGNKGGRLEVLPGILELDQGPVVQASLA